MTLAKPTFFAVGGGWRALAKAHIDGDQGAGPVTHGYALGAAEARDIRQIDLARLRRPSSRGNVPASQSRPRALAAVGGAHARPRAQAARDAESVVFSALGVREGLLYSQFEQ